MVRSFYSHSLKNRSVSKYLKQKKLFYIKRIYCDLHDKIEYVLTALSRKTEAVDNELGPGEPSDYFLPAKLDAPVIANAPYQDQIYDCKGNSDPEHDSLVDGLAWDTQVFSTAIVYIRLWFWFYIWPRLLFQRMMHF